MLRYKSVFIVFAISLLSNTTLASAQTTCSPLVDRPGTGQNIRVLGTFNNYNVAGFTPREIEFAAEHYISRECTYIAEGNKQGNFTHMILYIPVSILSLYKTGIIERRTAKLATIKLAKQRRIDPSVQVYLRPQITWSQYPQNDIYQARVNRTVYLAVKGALLSTTTKLTLIPSGLRDSSGQVLGFERFKYD